MLLSLPLLQFSLGQFVASVISDERSLDCQKYEF